MAGRHPLERRIGWEKRLIEYDFLILATESAETRLLPLSYWLKRARHLSNAINVPIFLDCLRVDASDRTSSNKKVFDNLWDKPPLPSLSRLSKQGTEVQFSLREPLKCRGGDCTESLRIDITHDPGLNIAQIQSTHIQFAEELFQQICRKNFADDVENLV